MIALALLAAGTVLQPLGDWRGWIAVRDYPVEAVIAAQEGTTNFALPIDANGLPTDCRITKSSGSKILDDQTCALMLIRARFRPPVDRRGRPIAATYRQTIHWRLPSAARPEAVVDRSFEALSTVAPNGAVVDCRLTGAGATRLGLAKGSCGPFGERGFLAFLIKDQYTKTRSADVRLSVTFEGALPPQLARQPNVYLTLAKATIDVGTDGKMAGCTSVTTLATAGKTLNLCEFVKTDPPRFPPYPTPRKATMLLDPERILRLRLN